MGRDTGAAMSGETVVTAAVLVIGNEILSGRTQDANLAYLGQQLNAIGVRLREARVVADLEDEIVAALNALRVRYDYVFTTGGIGPTHDDITSECVAKAFGVPLIRHPEAERRLRAHYEPERINEARLRMANTPDGATLIDNPVSIAPGYRIGNVFVLAGVPAIMRAMFDGLKPQLVGGAPVRSVSVPAYVAEGTIAEDLGALQARFPELDIGSYPFFKSGRFGTSLVLRGTDEAKLALAAQELRTLIRTLGAEPLDREPD
jgi:molybdenum cofactor synthesis domain-containing protein